MATEVEKILTSTMDTFSFTAEDILDETVLARLRSIKKRIASLKKEITENNNITARCNEGVEAGRRKIVLAVDKQRQILEKFGDKEKEIQLIEKKIAVAHQKIITCSERVLENNKFVDKVRKENRPGRRLQLEGILKNEKERRNTYMEKWQMLQQKKIKAEQNLNQIQTRWKYSLKFYRDLHSFNETVTKFINPNFHQQKKTAATLVLKVIEQNTRFVQAEKRISELLRKIRRCDYKKDGIDNVKNLYGKIVVTKPVPLPSFEEGEIAGKYTSDIFIPVY